MRTFIAALLMACSALLLGCAGTSAVVQSEYHLANNEKLRLQLNTPTTASEQGVAILRDRLTAQLTNHALLAATGDTSSKIIEVTVINYSMRPGAARALAGIMAGTDNIKSTVKIKDSVTHHVLAEFVVESKNPTAWGTSKGLIEDHADKIVETLNAARKG